MREREREKKRERVLQLLSVEVYGLACTNRCFNCDLICVLCCALPVRLIDAI